MEYCEGGDIATLIKNCKKEKNYIPEEIIWSVLA
jgi:NIMA (never in mitosis gene a)-related kinase